MKQVHDIRNEAGNKICEITFTKDGTPVITIVGRHCATDIILRPGKEPEVIHK